MKYIGQFVLATALMALPGFAAAGAHGGLSGDTIHIAPANLRIHPTAMMGPGPMAFLGVHPDSNTGDLGPITANVDGSDGGSINCTSPSNLTCVTFEVTNNQIILTAGPQGVVWTPGAFNGLKFLDGSHDPHITSVTLDGMSTAGGAATDDSTFTSNSVFLNFGEGETWQAGQQAIFDLTFAPFGVPEPGTWGLMLLGVAGIGFAARRRAAEPAAV